MNHIESSATCCFSIERLLLSKLNSISCSTETGDGSTITQGLTMETGACWNTGFASPTPWIVGNLEGENTVVAFV